MMNPDTEIPEGGPRGYRVGVYTELTEREAKTKYNRRYTEDYYGKPDYVGFFILRRCYPTFLGCLLLFTILFAGGLAHYPSLFTWIGFLVTFPLLSINLAVVAYRVAKYHC
jgi:hypothetical protein